MTERQRRGARAEAAAEAHLERLGLRVLERNLRVGRLEVDLVAIDGEAIALVEVRSRGATAWTGAAESVDRKKRDRLRRAGQLLWSRRFSKMPGIQRVRFDVCAVDLSGEQPVVEWIRAAF